MNILGFCLCIIVIIALLFMSLIWETELIYEPMPPLEAEGFPFHTFVINMDKNPERYAYVEQQLQTLGMTQYTRWPALDGFNATPETFAAHGITPGFMKRKGLAGCAGSHIALWRHIRDNQLPWCLILEDDVHFHPDFVPLFREYWQHVPQQAKIIFPGHCCAWIVQRRHMPINLAIPLCLHSYLLSFEGAQMLLDGILPVHNDIDVVLRDFWRMHSPFSAVLFNGNASIASIRPHDYKETNKQICSFEGIVYQNRKEYGRTLIQPNTVFETDP